MASKRWTAVENYAPGAVLGFRQTQKGSTWHLKLYNEQSGRTTILSLKVPYEEGSQASRNIALEKASDLYAAFQVTTKEGGDYYRELDTSSHIAFYVAEIKRKAQINEELLAKGKEPTQQVTGGQDGSFWTDRKAREAISLLQGFWVEERGKSVFKQGVVAEYLDSLEKRFESITERDLQRFRDWAAENRGYAPGTINKAIVQMKMIWVHAYYVTKTVNFIPKIKQAAANLEKRTRRKITLDEYMLLVRKSRERYQNAVDPKTKDLLYQFHHWILILSNSGIRPWGGAEEHLFPRWSDLRIEETESGYEWYLRRRSEKAHLDYDAAILEEAEQYVKNLQKLQEDREVDSVYIFAHTFDRPKRWKKGEPIKSFKKQWGTLLKECGLASPVGTPQSRKLVPYSLRGFFMTRRLEESPTLRLEDLAQATGSSAEIINLLYRDKKTDAVRPQLTLRKHGARSKLTPQFDADGYYIGRE